MPAFGHEDGLDHIQFNPLRFLEKLKLSVWRALDFIIEFLFFDAQLKDKTAKNIIR